MSRGAAKAHAKFFGFEALKFVLGDIVNLGVGSILQEGGLNLADRMGTNLVSGQHMASGVQGALLVATIQGIMLALNALRNNDETALKAAVESLNRIDGLQGNVTVEQLKQVRNREAMLVTIAQLREKGEGALRKKFDDAVDPAKFAKRYGMDVRFARELLENKRSQRLLRGIVTHGLLPIAIAGVVAGGVSCLTGMSAFLVQHASLKLTLEGLVGYIVSRVGEESVASLQDAGVFARLVSCGRNTDDAEAALNPVLTFTANA